MWPVLIGRVAGRPWGCQIYLRSHSGTAWKSRMIKEVRVHSNRFSVQSADDCTVYIFVSFHYKTSLNVLSGSFWYKVSFKGPIPITLSKMNSIFSQARLHHTVSSLILTRKVCAYWLNAVMRTVWGQYQVFRDDNNSLSVLGYVYTVQININRFFCLLFPSLLFIIVIIYYSHKGL